MADPKARELARMQGKDRQSENAKLKLPIRERVSPAPPQLWEEQGHCRRGTLPPDAWFPVSESDEMADRARRICKWCPVRELCLREAMAVPGTTGIWGGLDEQERRALKRREKNKAGANA